MTGLARKGGIVASIILILLGVGAMGAGVAGREKVQTDLAREQIVGTPDSSIPGQKVDTGGEAKNLIGTLVVSVNGEPESRRGRQLRAGDEVLVGDETLRVA